MGELIVTPERTPNPNAIKFSTNRRLNPDQARSFYSAEAARDDPLASRLFELSGVTGVMVLGDFCSVNKNEAADWDELIPRIEAVLKEVYEP